MTNSKLAVIERFVNRSSKKITPCGFQLTFENRNTINVQFGFGNECDNYDESFSESSNAEISIFNEAGEWYQFVNGNITIGNLTTDEIVKWIVFAKTNKF